MYANWPCLFLHLSDSVPAEASSWALFLLICRRRFSYSLDTNQMTEDRSWHDVIVGNVAGGGEGVDGDIVGGG